MKKAISALLCAIMLMSVLFSLAGCKDDDVPDGMQLVMGGDDVGYYMYGPEEWVVANLGDIACTYVSKLDMTSVTMTEAPMPDTDFESYMVSELELMPYDEIVRNTTEEHAKLGNADDATKYTYTYTYGGAKYGCMQILATYGGRFYIFTYTASMEEKSGYDKTYYAYYIDKVNEIIDNIVFVSKSGTDGDAAEYERDADGYLLVSDKSLCGFNLYVPDSYEVTVSNTMVCVVRDDGTSITVAAPTYPAETAEIYWASRKEALERVADRITVDGTEVSSLKEIEGKINVRFDQPNCDVAASFEYTYILDGTNYHVYQVIVRVGRNNYVYTYTAKEEFFEAHIDEAKDILGRINF